MNLIEATRAIVVAVQPHLDVDSPNPRGVDQLVSELNKAFQEEPNAKAAFIAAIQAIAAEARKGWRPI